MRVSDSRPVTVGCTRSLRHNDYSGFLSPALKTVGKLKFKPKFTSCMYRSLLRTFVTAFAVALYENWLWGVLCVYTRSTRKEKFWLYLQKHQAIHHALNWRFVHIIACISCFIGYTAKFNLHVPLYITISLCGFVCVYMYVSINLSDMLLTIGCFAIRPINIVQML